MSSGYSPWWKRKILYKIPGLFKKCPEGNFHWFWDQTCFCCNTNASDLYLFQNHTYYKKTATEENFNNLTYKNIEKTDTNDQQHVKKKFKNDDWIISIDKYNGCSQVHTDFVGELQPFSYLDDYNPDHYRLATEEEIIKAKKDIKGDCGC